MFHSFAEKFDIKRLKTVSQVIFILACLFLIVNIVGKAYSRYESTANVSAQASVAFFVIDQGTYENTISLTGLTPRTDPFYYNFKVMNYKNNKRCNVDLTYTIKFETTTNLPLQYEVIRNESFDDPDYTNLLTTSTMRQDEHDVFYKVYTNNNTYSFTHTSNQTDSYTLKVIFPLNNKNFPDAYQGAVEVFSIIINATQVA